MGALDELLSAWRANPDAESTVALAAYLGATGREDLIREIGSSAEAWHQTDGDVMLAVGRMYLDAGLLPEAQQALVAAGRANPHDGRPFRYLGEVLLRRGDALRAEKVLARSVQLGQNDSETRLWYDRAVVYVALQKRAGPSAVAAEVERTLPRRPSTPPPTLAATRAAIAYPEDEATIARAIEPPLSSANARRAPPSSRMRPAAAHSFASEPPTMPAADSFGRVPRSAPQQPAWAAATVGAAPEPMPAAPTSRAAQRPPLPPTKTTQLGLGPQLGQMQPMPQVERSPLDGAATAPRPAFASFRPHPPPPRPRPEDSPYPDPELVLEHLGRAGVWEAGGGPAPDWERAEPARVRGSWVLVLAIVLCSLGGGGGYFYARHIKLLRLARAHDLTEEVDRLVRSPSIDDLRATDSKLSTVFDLDSRNQRAARQWLENRVLTALMTNDKPRGVDAAVHRAIELGVPEEQVAFGRIVAFLAADDVAGAVGLLPRWDPRAGKDGFYQLAAAAALERAGDARAIERYQAAHQLDSKLVAADLLLARLVLLELGPDEGRLLVDELKTKIGDRPESRALAGLLWALDPEGPNELPSELQIADPEREKLPLPLRPLPYVVNAVRAMRASDPRTASSELASAVGLSMTPMLATRLGSLAIDAGDEKLARRAALRALELVPTYPGARALASRVALLSGRLDEAKKPLDDLDPKSSEVQTLRAITAYEKLDSTELASAIKEFGAAKKREKLAGLVAASGVLMGKAYPDVQRLATMADPSVSWGEIIAVDAALDTGNLDVADDIVTKWGATSRPLYLVRVSRLRRAQGKLAVADAASKAALEQGGTITTRMLVERLYVLIERKESDNARELMAKYPSLLGTMTDWLGLLADVAANHEPEANFKAATLNPPSDIAPLLFRVLAARGLSAAHDNRARIYVKYLEHFVPKHPDLAAAEAAMK